MEPVRATPPAGLPAARTLLLHVVATRQLTPRMRRISLAGDDLDGFIALPGQDIVLRLVDDQGGAVRRRYTLRDVRPAERRCDVDIVLHGHGPGARWGATVAPGDQVEAFGPRGKVVPSEAAWQLFVGDESALPAIAELVGHVPAGVRGVALLEVADAAEEQPFEMAAGSGFDVHWLHRADAAPGGTALLEAALAAVRVPDRDRHVYLFAESRVVRRLRDLLYERGLRAAEVSAKGYWNLGRATGE